MAEEAVKKLETVELKFDGELKECTVTIDKNGEFLCETENGDFVKFPKDSDLAEEVDRYNEAN